jgi:hypothetical protein
MNKGFLALFALLLLCSFVNAEGQIAIVSGDIYDASTGLSTPNAEVTVECFSVDVPSVKTAITDGEGFYYVVFDNTETEKCEFGDTVRVFASKEDKQGEVIGTVDIILDDEYKPHSGVVINLALIDVPLVPEFGIIAGSITIFISMCVLFTIRRK